MTRVQFPVAEDIFSVFRDETVALCVAFSYTEAVIAQLGERQTEDLKVPGSIPGRGIFLHFLFH